MNKIKVALVAMAIMAGVGGAFATTCVTCDNAPQYIWNGSMYVRVGIFGEDYDCDFGAATCTYYQPDPIGQPNNYTPCKVGGYNLTK